MNSSYDHFKATVKRRQNRLDKKDRISKVLNSQYSSAEYKIYLSENGSISESDKKEIRERIRSEERKRKFLIYFVIAVFILACITFYYLILK